MEEVLLGRAIIRALPEKNEEVTEWNFFLAPKFK